MANTLETIFMKLITAAEHSGQPKVSNLPHGLTVEVSIYPYLTSQTQSVPRPNGTRVFKLRIWRSDTYPSEREWRTCLEKLPVTFKPPFPTQGYAEIHEPGRNILSGSWELVQVQAGLFEGL